MGWMPSHRFDSQTGRTQEAILANVHRGLVLASASRRLQDSISSRRASTEARQLLTAAKKLCEQASDVDVADERIRIAIASLTQALDL
jgi:hypothetical protein